MDIFEQLMQEHRQVNDLIAEIKSNTNPDTDERRDLLIKVKLLLIPHAKAEQKTLYARLNEEEQMQDQMKEAQEEHHDIETLLLEMENMDPSSEEWMKQLGRLEESINHHVTEEETEIFAKAKDLLEADEPKELLFEYEAEKQDLMESM